MEPKFKTSFIPKRPIAVQEKRTKIVRVKRGTNIFSFLPMIIFLAAIVLSGGVYAYRVAIEGQINSQIKDLEQAKSSFDPSFVGEASRLSDRLTAANLILSNHLSPTAMFRLLEASTLQTISFDTFTFTDGDDDTINISGSGVARGFASIVLQSDKFGETGYMKDVIFSDLQTSSEDNTVSFSFDAAISPEDFLLYENNLNRIESSSVSDEESDTQEDATEAEIDEVLNDIEDIIDSELGDI